LAGLETAALMAFELTARRAITKVINPAASGGSSAPGQGR